MDGDGLPPLPPVESIDTRMVKAIRDTPISNGLAILIGCTNSSKSGQTPLSGVVKDLRTLQQTFSEQLLFTTVCLNDPSEKHIRMVVKCTSELGKNAIQLPPMWQRIVVTFSGHGDEDYLYTRDGHIRLREDIVSPLQASQRLATVPKLFFVDACRGPDEDEGVHVDLSWFYDNTGPVPRGGGRLPSEGNCYIAYSTLSGMQSFEHPHVGGFWIQILARELTKQENVDKTIQDIMTRVNSAMVDICNKRDIPLQQPVNESTLRVDIKLLLEAQDLRQQLQPHQQQLVEYQPQPQQLVEYQQQPQLQQQVGEYQPQLHVQQQLGGYQQQLLGQQQWQQHRPQQQLGGYQQQLLGQQQWQPQQQQQQLGVYQSQQQLGGHQPQQLLQHHLGAYRPQHQLQHQQQRGLQQQYMPSGFYYDKDDLLPHGSMAEGRGPPGNAKEVAREDGAEDNGHLSSETAQGQHKGEEVKRPSIAAVFPSGSENCANGSTDVQKADAYALLLSRYTRSCGMEESYADTPCFVEEYNHTYYTSQLEIKGSGTWEGTRCHFSPEIAREEVAKMAYQSLTGQSVGPTTLTTQEAKQLPMINPSPSVAPRVSSTPNHRTLLNEYCQKYGVSHRHEFIEDHSTGQAMFKCTITCLLNGSKIVQDSGQYYPKKDDAREIAAHRILLKIKEREKSHSRGATGVGAAAAAASNAPNMIWKSRLKERYDKQGKAGLELKYKVTEVEGGFVASVFIPELSREVKGEKGRTKKEAEQNTAKKAIQLLPK